MFSRAATNPLDDLVSKATDENLTSENWELILSVCDKVDADTENGARNAILAVQKRLGHRNANVQLSSLTVGYPDKPDHDLILTTPVSRSSIEELRLQGSPRNSFESFHAVSAASRQ